MRRNLERHLGARLKTVCEPVPLNFDEARAIG
jgi:hypothetical protein